MAKGRKAETTNSPAFTSPAPRVSPPWPSPLSPNPRVPLTLNSDHALPQPCPPDICSRFPAPCLDHLKETLQQTTT
ncbi:hypothetical protein NQZ68_016835 [Dissostichus eleginoides]|nr:hypothetical protein NQZ68_016835 [Dissostichus eleginoides]